MWRCGYVVSVWEKKGKGKGRKVKTSKFADYELKGKTYYGVSLEDGYLKKTEQVIVSKFTNELKRYKSMVLFDSLKDAISQQTYQSLLLKLEGILDDASPFTVYQHAIFSLQLKSAFESPQLS